MNSEKTSLTYRFHLPFSGDLQPLLEQPYVTTAILRDLLRRRGTFINSQDKNQLVSFLKLSFLSPEEFDFLMSLAIDREEKKKVRNDYDELTANREITLAAALPTLEDLALRDLLSGKIPNCSLMGSPTLERINAKHYRLKFSLRRRNLHSNWLKSEQEFAAEINFKKDDEKGVVKTESWHTSEETRKACRIIAGASRKIMVKSGLIEKDQTITLRFNSFDNYSRIAFLMNFTESFPREDYEFEKLVDLSLRLDESSDCDDERLKWMKQKVSKLNLSGTALQDTFFVTDKLCRKHLLVWRFECRYKFSKSDGLGTITVAFEFGGYSKTASPLAPFQITCVSLSASRYNGSHRDLEKKIIASLNEYQIDFWEKAKALQIDQDIKSVLA
jgi:hypothetical protein